MKIIKRDLRKIDLDFIKIKTAIEKAGCTDLEVFSKIKNHILHLKESDVEFLTVEEVQDIVEIYLPIDIKEKYRNYREARAEERKSMRDHHKMISSIVSFENEDVLNENGNMCARTPSGILNKISTEDLKVYTDTHLLDKEHADLHNLGIIHIHDKDWYATRSITCIQQDLKTLKEGCMLYRPAKSLRAAFSQVVTQIQNIQAVQHGGQAVPALDFQLASFVEKEFNNMWELIYPEEIIPNREGLDYINCDIIEDKKLLRVFKAVKRQAMQAAEAFVHDLNSLKSRSGNQVPFSSVNLGSDSSPEGRLITYAVLKAMESGIGPSNKTAIFPIVIFKLLNAVNGQGKPNYDLRRLAMEVMVKRQYPKFINLDNGYNLGEKWDINDPERWKYECSTMGW